MKTAGIFIMPKIPEISLEVKWRIHFCFEYLGLPSIGLPKFAFPFLTNRFTALLLLWKEFGKGIKIARVRFPLVGAVWWKVPRVFAYMKYPALINAILGHYARFWIFWRESFGARKLRLAARGSRLGLAGSQNSLPFSIMLSVSWKGRKGNPSPWGFFKRSLAKFRAYIKIDICVNGTHATN